jgi:hypothetical protein
MQAWSIIAAAVTLAVVASAQAVKHESPTMVLPIPGIPLSVDAIEEYVSKGPDGISTRQINQAKYYRDAAGRMRTEMAEPNSIDRALAGVALDNPIDGFIAVLEPQTKLAHRVKFPKSNSTDEWGIGAGPKQ